MAETSLPRAAVRPPGAPTGTSTRSAAVASPRLRSSRRIPPATAVRSTSLTVVPVRCA